MKTRHGDKKREIMWDSSKPSSTEIVPVLTERNATSIQPLQQTLPEKACSDSHLCVPKEASTECVASIESVDIDQGGSEALVLIENRRRHNVIIDEFKKEHGIDSFPFDLIKKSYPEDRKELTLALKVWASVTSPYKFPLKANGTHTHTLKGRTFKWTCLEKGCPFKILAEQNAEGGLSICDVLRPGHSDECRKKNVNTTTLRLVAQGVKCIPPKCWDLALLLAHAKTELPKINTAITLQYRNEYPGSEISWDYDHLYYRLQKENLIGRGNDEELVEFLNEQVTRGTHARFWTNASSDAIERIYWEMPGAKELIGRGANCVIYDTTHGTNNCKMKLGMFIASDEYGKSIVLAVTLMSYESARAFRGFFSEFKKNFNALKVIFTDSDPAMKVAIEKALPETQHLLCIYHLQQNFDNSYRKTLCVGINAESFARRLSHMMYHDNDKTFMATFEADWEALIKLLPEKHRELYDKVAADEAIRKFDSSEEKFLLDNVNADDEFEAVVHSEKVRELREKFSSKRSALESAIIWLHKMYKRHQMWHRAFVMSQKTFGAFSTQRSESMHAALKSAAGGNREIKKMSLCRLLQLIENMQNAQKGKREVERERREQKKDFAATFLGDFQENYTYHAYDIVKKKFDIAMNYCSFDEEIYKNAVKKLSFYPRESEVVVIQKLQVEKNGETVEIFKRFTTTACRCSCQFLDNTGLPCEHIIYLCKNIKSCHDKILYEKLPVDVIGVDYFWKKAVSVILDDDNDDDLPCPNPADDDDFDTILDPAKTVNLAKKEKLQLMRTSFFNRCEGLVVNCADAAVVAFVDHMNAVVDDYIQSHPEDFPKADKVFIDERTNRPYTAPQQSRGCGGRDSTKRKESAAALGRKAAAKKSK